MSTKEESFPKESIEKLNKPLKIAEFKQLSKKLPVIDTRLQAQTTGLIKNSYWLPNQQLIQTQLPVLLQPNQPYLLIIDRSQHEQILKQFLSLKYENLQGYNCFDMKKYEGDLVYPLLRNFKELGDTERKLFVDVRTKEEREETGVVRGAYCLDLDQLVRNQGKEVLSSIRRQQKRKLIVLYCGNGTVCKLAASLLLRNRIYPVILIEEVSDLPKLGLTMISPQKNQEYLLNKSFSASEESSSSSEQENLQQKSLECDNMNRMAVEECYEECLKKNQPSVCLEKCTQKQTQKKPEETMRLEHAKNRNQFEAGKPRITSYKKQLERTRTNMRESDKIIEGQAKISVKGAMDEVQKGNYEQGIKQLNKLIQSNPSLPELYINRSICQSYLNHHQAAFKDLYHALSLDHLNFIAYFNLASLQLAAQPHSFEARHSALGNLYCSLAGLYFIRGQKMSDLNDINRALEYVPNMLEALMVRSVLYCQTGRFIDALEDLARVKNVVTGDKNEEVIDGLMQKIKAKICKEINTQTQVEHQNPQHSKQQSEQKRKPSQFETKLIQAEPSSLLKSKPLTFLNQQQLNNEISFKVELWNSLYQQLLNSQLLGTGKIQQMVIKEEGKKVEKQEEKLSPTTVWVVE